MPQEIVEITSRSGIKVRVAPIPELDMFNAIVCSYNDDVNWDDDELAELGAKQIVYRSLYHIVGKGYISLREDDLKKMKKRVVRDAGELGHLLLKNPKLLFANIILGPHGLFPDGELDKFPLWAICMKQADLDNMQIDFSTILRAAIEASK